MAWTKQNSTTWVRDGARVWLGENGWCWETELGGRGLVTFENREDSLVTKLERYKAQRAATKALNKARDAQQKAALGVVFPGAKITLVGGRRRR